MTTTETHTLFVSDRWKNPAKWKPIALPGKLIDAWPDSYIDTALHVNTDAGRFWCKNVYADKVVWERLD